MFLHKILNSFICFCYRQKKSLKTKHSENYYDIAHMNLTYLKFEGYNVFNPKLIVSKFITIKIIFTQLFFYDN